MDSQFIDFKIISKLERQDIIKQCEGENSKGVFLFYHQSDTDQLSFLKKILQAVQLDYEKDVLALAGTPKLSFSIADLIPPASIRKVIVFGFPPQQLGLQLQLAKYQAYSIGGITYLFGDALSTIAQKPVLKKSLWEGLQHVFREGG